MPGGTVSDVIDDDARADDPARMIEPEVAECPPTRRTGRTWLRRVAVGIVVVLAAVALGFQVQVAKVQEQIDLAETDQRLAEIDEETAGYRLASVDARVRTAQQAEDEAQGTLDRSRAGMEAQGLQEASLGDVRVQMAQDVKDLRSAVERVGAQIAEQGRLQPAAGACLFDLLRALGRVDDAHDSGARSEACTTVAATPGPA
ncbi:hypothetical protein ACE2AJ_04460 [Aquihabitans daechungensis]|uniref:hypothetical protein n=1 Tax=Aquihabitans daechungensis TaxID=1052257 RepID=UPI003B9E1CEE